MLFSFPGLATQLGARVREIGDDRQWFADARGPKAYAGAFTHHPAVWQEVQRHPTLGGKRLPNQEVKRRW
ncbi:hypothetical protein [Streptomyces goshikiensis]|uniref:hypothetical protein n=1 Tax=Streptomyces goshikiensis TaxID=1942 RepID=UPI00365C13B2